MVSIYTFAKQVSFFHRLVLFFTCFFLVGHFITEESSAETASKCNGIIVQDLSSLEKELSFTRSEIPSDYDGYIGFFQVVASDGRVLSQDYDKEALRERALEYSASQCAPKKIVYPDIQIVVELYEKGKVVSRTELENGGKILKRELFYKPAGVLLAEYPYRNGKIHGPVRYFHESGKLNYELNYKGGKRHGCFESHYKGGKVKGVGCFTYDRLTGPYKYYYENGDVGISANYDSNGNLDGEYLEQYEGGNPKTKAFYRSGSLDREYREWFESGRVHVVAQYTNGKILDKGIVYFEDGSISEEYQNGSRDKPGQHKRFFEKGSLLSKVSVVDGEYEGMYEEFNEDGKLIAVANYKAGIPIGAYKRFYENGVLQSVTEYKNGRTVSSTSYYEHGGIYQKAYYDDDGLLQYVDAYDIYGALDTRFPYKEGEITGMVLKFYRNGNVALAAYIENGKIVNPVVGYDQNGKEAYKVNYDDKGDISSFVTFFSSGQLNHFLIREEGKTKQYEFLRDGSLKYASVIDVEGNEKREFYDHYIEKPTMTQEFSGTLGLKNIFYNLDTITLGCVQLDSKGEYVCGMINKDDPDNVIQMDTQVVFDKLAEWINEQGLEKPEILPLINTSSEVSIFQENNKDIISEAVGVNSLGKKCYNLGFMEHCE